MDFNQILSLILSIALGFAAFAAFILATGKQVGEEVELHNRKSYFKTFEKLWEAEADVKALKNEVKELSDKNRNLKYELATAQDLVSRLKGI